MNSSIRNKNLPFHMFSLLLSPVSFGKQLIPCLMEKAWKRNLNMINYHYIKEKLQHHKKSTEWLRLDRASVDQVSPTLPFEKESPGADFPGQCPGEPGDVQGWGFQPTGSPSGHPPLQPAAAVVLPSSPCPRADYPIKLKISIESRENY